MVSPTSAMRCERRSAMGSVSVACAHPFGAGPGLAGAAAAEQEPGVPGLALGRHDRGELVVAAAGEPVVDDAVELAAGADDPLG